MHQSRRGKNRPLVHLPVRLRRIDRLLLLLGPSRLERDVFEVLQHSNRECDKGVFGFELLLGCELDEDAGIGLVELRDGGR